MLTIGPEIEGYIPLGKASITCSAGDYSWLVAGTYTFNETKTRSYIKGCNYSITASLGLSFQITQSFDMYIKAIGKYYDLHISKPANSLNFPASNNFTAMIEIGFKGADGFEKTQ